MTDESVDFTEIVIEVRDGRVVRAYSSIHDDVEVRLTVHCYDIAPPWAYLMNKALTESDKHHQDDEGNWYEKYEIGDDDNG